MKRTIFFCSTLLLISISISGQGIKPDLQAETDRTNAYASQLEKYLDIYLVDQYNERAASACHRDYSSTDAFKRSVEPNRSRWIGIISKLR
jgi:hypothetical protein